MAKKNREAVNQAIEDNVFDNNNKEIIASMVRSVLKDMKDSHFNLISDELANVKYEGNKTLKQILQEVAGSIPEYGFVKGVDIGSTSVTDFTIEGDILSSARLKEDGGGESLIEINFSKSIGNRRIIPVLHYNHNLWGKANDSLPPIIRRISSQQIDLSIREITGSHQDLDIEIIVL